MYILGLRFLSLLFTGLLMGAVSVDWVLNTTPLDVAEYITYKQWEIPVLTATLVPLGGATIALVLLQAYLERRQRFTLWLILAGAVGLIAMGLLTRLVHFPLNARILSWSVETPPDDWQAVREQWNVAHSLRTLLGLGSFALLLLAALLPHPRRTDVGAGVIVSQPRSSEDANA